MSLPYWCDIRLHHPPLQSRPGSAETLHGSEPALQLTCAPSIFVEGRVTSQGTPTGLACLSLESKGGLDQPQEYEQCHGKDHEPSCGEGSVK